MCLCYKYMFTITIVYITTPALPHNWFPLGGRPADQQGVEGSGKVQ